MQPLCAGLSFPASVGTTAEAGNNYGCLRSVPNPAWYFLRMATPGEMRTLLRGIADVDFALWGPYPALNDALGACGSLPAPIDCSYSAAPTETPRVPSTSQVGDYYVLLFTNFANVPQDVSFERTGGPGTTSCDVLSSPAIPCTSHSGHWVTRPTH